MTDINKTGKISYKSRNRRERLGLSRQANRLFRGNPIQFIAGWQKSLSPAEEFKLKLSDKMRRWFLDSRAGGGAEYIKTFSGIAFMRLILINGSVALVTRDYMPVTHDFLINQKIIPESFQKTNSSFSTPVASQIHYKNGFSITIEPQKTMIQFQKPSADESESLKNLNTLEDIASKYVDLFKPIKYQAVGINFDFIREDLKYSLFIEKMIKTDNPHLNFENNAGNIQRIDLSYNLKGKQFNVTVIKAEKKPQNTSQPNVFVPFFKFNAHYPDHYAGNKAAVIEELKENYERSKKFIGRF